MNTTKPHSARAHRRRFSFLLTIQRGDVTPGVLFAIMMATTGVTEAQIFLNVQHGPTVGEVVLTWSGGTSPYNLYAAGSGDFSGAGVGVLLSNSSTTSYTGSGGRSPAIGEVVFFNVGDAAAPQPTITSPANGGTYTGGHLAVQGNISAPVAAVWVNRRPSQILGTSFTASDVLLVLGDNDLRAAAIAGDGNIALSSSRVTRIPGNDPPMLTIVSPAEGAQLWDVTPFVQVTYSDTEALDHGKFRAYLDGTEVTLNFTPTSVPLGQQWQVAAVDRLDLGTHVLRVTIQDADGYTQSASSQFRVAGPRIDSISPSKAAPGTTVTITGEGFSTGLYETFLYFGDEWVTASSITTTQIRATVPTSIVQDCLVTVEVIGIRSNSLPFDVAFTTAGGQSVYLAIDSFDRIYYVDRATFNTVYRVDQNGSGLVTFFTTGYEIGGIAFDPTGATLYISTRGAPFYEGTQYIYATGYIYSVDLNGAWTLRFVLDPFSSPRFSDPGGLDVRPPFVYVGAVQADVADQVLRLDLNNPQTRTVLINFPLSDWILGDVRLDDLGNIYTMYSPPGVYTYGIYIGAGMIYNTRAVGGMTVDCLHRVVFADVANGVIHRLDGFQQSTQLASTGGSPSGLDLDSKGNIFVGVNNAVRRATGASATVTACSSDFAVSLTGDLAQLFADYDHSTSAETPDSQMVVLTACLTPSNIPRDTSHRVYWTFTDVDDPATDTTVDPNGLAGGDNIRPLPVDNSPPFRQEGSYTLTVGSPGPRQYGSAYDASGCSEVRFHYSDAPGDNFTVTAELATALGSQEVTSKTMTVWKRVHVELDSMGDVEGSIPADDAVIGDIPDPVPSLLAAAFAAAYIVLVNDGPGATSDVDFDHHVPDEFTFDLDPDLVAQVRAQGRLGRETGNISASGHWSIYAQGAYEGYADQDNDPDPPDVVPTPLIGITNGRLGRYTLSFSEVIRDWADQPSRDEGYIRAAVVLHEFGHQFVSLVDHEPTTDGSGGIMETGTDFAFPYFNARWLRMIRDRALNNGYPSQLE